MRISTFYEHIAEAAIQEGKPVGEICAMVHDFGVEGVELDGARMSPQNIFDRHKVKQARQELEDAGLGISCIYRFFDFGYERQLDAAGKLSGVSPTQAAFDLVDLAKDMGTDKVMPIPGFLKFSEKPGSPAYQEVVNRMIRGVDMLCDYAAKEGIAVVMEDFDSDTAPFATSAQLKAFLDEIAGLNIAFDTGNFLYSGEDVMKAYEVLKPRIAHVHLKDRIMHSLNGDEGTICPDGRVIYGTAAGYGDLPLSEIVRDLKAGGYTGTFATEHFGSKNQLEDMRLSAKWLKEQLL